MTTTPLPKPLPPPTVPTFRVLLDQKGNVVGVLPTREYAQYLQSLDDAVRTLCSKI